MKRYVLIAGVFASCLGICGTMVSMEEERELSGSERIAIVIKDINDVVEKLKTGSIDQDNIRLALGEEVSSIRSLKLSNEVAIVKSLKAAAGEIAGEKYAAAIRSLQKATRLLKEHSIKEERVLEQESQEYETLRQILSSILVIMPRIADSEGEIELTRLEEYALHKYQQDIANLKNIPLEQRKNMIRTVMDVEKAIRDQEYHEARQYAKKAIRMLGPLLVVTKKINMPFPKKPKKTKLTGKPSVKYSYPPVKEGAEYMSVPAEPSFSPLKANKLESSLRKLHKELAELHQRLS